MTLVVTGFTALPSSPKTDNNEWDCCQNKGVRDPVTGDLCQFRCNTGTAPIQLYTSQDNGATWTRIATDATTPYAGNLSVILSVVQDVTNGAVHFLTYGRSGSITNPGYGRATFTRSGGHVTGFTWTRTPVAITAHGGTGADPRGQIGIFKKAGTEYIVYILGVNDGSGTVFQLFSAVSTGLTPNSSTDFTGLAGAGSDSTILNLSDGTGIRNNHTMFGAFAQDDSTEDLYLFYGACIASDTLLNTGSNLQDVCWKRFAYSAGSWTVPTATVAGTTLQGDDGSYIPSLMGVFTGPGLGRAYVAYMSPTAGVKVSYLNGGGSPTATTITGSPLSTTHRGGMGAISVSTTGEIYLIAQTMGLNDASPASVLSYWNGSSWNSTAGSALLSMSVSGSVPWNTGLGIASVQGSGFTQVATGTVYTATIAQGADPVAVLSWMTA